MNEHGRLWTTLLDAGWLSPLLRLLGVLTPALYLLLYPWPMAGGEILLGFGGMAIVSGALLRTWWAALIVPAVTVAVLVGYALAVRGGFSLAGDEFTTGGAVVAFVFILYLMAIAALLGVLIGRQVLRDSEAG